MDRKKVFNEFLYEVLEDIEDLARNSILDEKDEDSKNILALCKKLSDVMAKMDKNAVFEDNLIGFCSTLSPEEEDILFYNLAVFFYENWWDLYIHSDDDDSEPDDKVDAFALCMAGEMIVRMLDNYLGYDYFEEEEEE